MTAREIKQLAWPMAERQIEHRKSCLVLSARFPVVNWRSSPVAKSAKWNDDSTLILKETRRKTLSQKGYQDFIKSIQWKFFRHSALENRFSTSPNKLYLETEEPVFSAFFVTCSNSITQRVATCYVMSTIRNLLKRRRWSYLKPASQTKVGGHSF